MKAYRVTAIDRRDETILDKCLVVADNFDLARAAALDHFQKTWGEQTPIEFSSIETLNEDVVISPDITEAIVEARV